ncbi:MAG: transketolase [Bacteroidales bacterium]|nr:transketolase [Bacteroidales bacterium]
MEQKAIDLKAADNVRLLAAAMVEKAKSGHPGGAMGGADFVHVLFSEFLKFDPNDPEWDNRDRFFLDPGHMSPMLYSILTLINKFSLEDIKNFRQWGSVTPGHPERDIKRGIENTSGPLGVGHALGIGAAIAQEFLAARFGKRVQHKTYVYISDGGIQEEISQGAGRIAGFLGLKNLIMFYDSNKIQLSTSCTDVSEENTYDKYKSWGWNVVKINGNDAAAIRQALKNAQNEKSRPTLIIGDTKMGKGIVTENNENFEGKCSTHGQPVSKSGGSFEMTVKHLGGNPENPFEIFPEVKEYYAQKLAEKAEAAKAEKAEEAKWAAENPELAKKYQQYLNNDFEIPALNDLTFDKATATRGSLGKTLAAMYGKVENLVVASADLSNSDKTDEFLKKTKAFVPGDFSGSFLQAGVSELTMAALCVGMMLHGGVKTVCGTFFVFSDYEKPVLRVAALMKTPAIFLYTHDSFRVGEDGPTHEPIEQEAQIRLMEQVDNHDGKMSTLVLRPADAYESIEAYKMAIANTECPTVMIGSRQNIDILPQGNAASQLDRAAQIKKGGYVVCQTKEGNPDVVLVANGSEVATLVGAAGTIAEKTGKVVRVVSVISPRLFENQGEAYVESVIPSKARVLGMTAGLPSVFATIIPGFKKDVFGLTHFGASAPAGVLDEKFGFKPELFAQWAVEKLK